MFPHKRSRRSGEPDYTGIRTKKNNASSISGAEFANALGAEKFNPFAEVNKPNIIFGEIRGTTRQQIVKNNPITEEVRKESTPTNEEQK